MSRLGMVWVCGVYGEECEEAGGETRGEDVVEDI